MPMPVRKTLPGDAPVVAPEKALLYRKNVGDVFNFRGWVVRATRIGKEMSYLPGGVGIFETFLEPVRVGVATERELRELRAA